MLKRLGCGAFGVVYEAEERGGEVCSVKIAHPGREDILCKEAAAGETIESVKGKSGFLSSKKSPWLVS